MHEHVVVDRVNDAKVVIVGFVLSIVLVAIVAGLATYFRWEYGRMFEARRNAPPRELAQHRAWENQRLNEYGWVDKQGGVVHIPVAEAAKLVLRERGR